MEVRWWRLEKRNVLEEAKAPGWLCACVAADVRTQKAPLLLVVVFRRETTGSAAESLCFWP